MSSISADQSVRVRFAPSPTGHLHIGGLRTALYNYLFARKHDGAFILRVEDTDRERYVEGAEEDIFEALAWSGLGYDEGPDVGGPVGPYRQSERGDIYQKYTKQLLEQDHAYYAFDTVEEIEGMRQEQATEENPTPAYDASTRHLMRNSLTLSEEETQELLDDGVPYVVRLRVDSGETITFEDEVRGIVSFESHKMDDQVLLKSDGLPTYHLANVVDDHLMGVTHIIRGEEWLPSTPKHMLLYDAFGWEPPKVAHLPLIMSPKEGKLSKRDAEDLGIPVSVHQYEEEGYEPAALLNFLAFLGWNPGTEQELFSLQELGEAFTLDRVGSSGVQFNIDKLNWFNQQYLIRMDPADLAARFRPTVEQAGYDASDEYLTEVAKLMAERLELATDIVDEGSYFFEAPTSYDKSDVEKRWRAESSDVLTDVSDELEQLDSLTEETAESSLKAVSSARDIGLGRVIHPVRLALSGSSSGPGIYELMALLGKSECIERMHAAAGDIPELSGAKASS